MPGSTEGQEKRMRNSNRYREREFQLDAKKMDFSIMTLQYWSRFPKETVRSQRFSRPNWTKLWTVWSELSVELTLRRRLKGQKVRCSSYSLKENLAKQNKCISFKLRWAVTVSSICIHPICALAFLAFFKGQWHKTSV